ncbi:hypothetical protein [Cereibacter sphaeroides]|uniref:hypothetical protein n=3 Tax=Cereibacter sphaeroides TaxID=1063 RepID=UPI0012DA5C7E|nr:hypothetical protein [Cereibacter sphaeroides]QHA11697.1 hypothetical protein GQR99_16005 [Cereibacter sphaeroides]QHA14630.1 hypothetical protein GQY06_15975 [Cereibacter sphaeroides]
MTETSAATIEDEADGIAGCLASRFVLSSALFDIDDDEGICGRFGRFDGGPDAYRLTSFGDDVGESFTVLWVTLLR